METCVLCGKAVGERHGEACPMDDRSGWEIEAGKSMPLVTCANPWGRA